MTDREMRLEIENRKSNWERANEILNSPAVDQLLEDVANHGLNKLGLQPTPTPVIDGGSDTMPYKFTTKDSGERVEFDSGMRRDAGIGKPRYDLIPVRPLKRLAELYARGAEKYGERNWQLADSAEELQRFKASGLRHFFQALDGETDEDHLAAVVFNVFAIMFLGEKLA